MQKLGKLIVASFVGLAIGSVAGCLVCCKLKVDLDGLISVLALIATVFIMPFVVDKYLSKRRSTAQLLDENVVYIIACLEPMLNCYICASSNKEFGEDESMRIVGNFKRASIRVNMICGDDSPLKNVANVSEIKSQYKRVYVSCTEKLFTKNAVSKNDLVRAYVDLSNMIFILNELRYKLLAY